MKTHRFDSVSFLAGLAMAVVGFAFLLFPRFGDLVDAITDVSSWLWPVVFIAVGIAILAPMAIGRRERQVREELDRGEAPDESQLPDGS